MYSFRSYSRAAAATEDSEDEEEESDDEDDEEEDEESEDEEMDEGEESGGGNKGGGGLKQSAAGLCISAGSFSDPPELPGLAHFLEHMVFMGSEKYPDENSFDRFVNLGGGYDNAHTDTETTVFYFDIQRKKFKEGNGRTNFGI